MAWKWNRYPLRAGVIAFAFMATQQDEFGARYDGMGEAELLGVARDYESLTAQATGRETWVCGSCGARWEGGDV